jgi:hypothetical protein
MALLHAGARAAGVTLAELVRGAAAREAREVLRDARERTEGPR